MVAAIGLVILGLAIALRLYSGAGPESASGLDRCFHFVFIDMIRRSRGRGKLADERFLLPGDFTYPLFYHWLLSFLPQGMLRSVDRFSGLAYDLIVGGMLTALLAASGFIPRDYAAATLGLYLLAPGLTLTHIGPRAFSLTPRNFSQLLSGTLIVILLAKSAAILPPVPWLWQGCEVLLIAGMLLSSKFSLQFLVLTLPTFILITGDYELLAVATAGFVVAWLGSGGYFARQVAGQCAHLSWYRRNLAYLAITRGNFRAALRAVARLDIEEAAKELLARNPILSGLARHFLLLPAVVATAFAPRLTAAEETALALVLAAMVPWLLTSFGRFRILGEAERYLEFAFPAQWYLAFGVLLRRHPAMAVGTILALHLLAYVVNIAARRRQYARSGAIARRAVAQAIDRHPGARLLVLDDTEAFCFYLETRAAICSLPNPLSPGALGWDFIDRFYAPFPYVAPEIIPQLCRTYALDLAVLKRPLNPRSATPPDYQRFGWRTIYENDHYVLSEIPKADGHEARR